MCPPSTLRADPNLYEACKDDADAQCKGIKNGGGRIQGCLRDKRMSLTWACEEQLFRQEMENADDLRLSVRLFAKCLPDKRKFCKDVEPGHARAKECLEENREDLSSDCKDEVDSMIERRVKDFRLDPKLREVCEDEIFNSESCLTGCNTTSPPPPPAPPPPPPPPSPPATATAT